MLTKVKDFFNFKEKRAQKIASICVLLALTAGFILLWSVYGDELYKLISDEAHFKAWIASFGRWDDIIFVTIRAVQTVVKIIPAEPLEIGAGYIFGAWYGCLLCWLGSMIGSLVIIMLTKFLGMKMIELFIPRKRFESIKFLQNAERLKVSLFVIYLIPSTPKDLITYFAPFLPINILTFLAISGVARIPSIITSTICGAAIERRKFLTAAIVFGATAVVGFISVLIYRKVTGHFGRNGKKDDGNDEDKDAPELDKPEASE